MIAERLSARDRTRLDGLRCNDDRNSSIALDGGEIANEGVEHAAHVRGLTLDEQRDIRVEVGGAALGEPPAAAAGESSAKMPTFLRALMIRTTSLRSTANRRCVPPKRCEIDSRKSSKP